MNSFFGDGLKSYLDLIHVRWYRLFKQVYYSENVCWVGELPAVLQHKDELLNVSKNSLQVKALPSALPIPSNLFDLVVFSNVGRGIGRQALSFQESARIVSDGGFLLCFDITSVGRLGGLANRSGVKRNDRALLKSECFNILNSEGLHLVREIKLFYRPVCGDWLFNMLGCLEVISPFLSPWSANVRLTVWCKKNAGEIIDESSCKSWG